MDIYCHKQPILGADFLINYNLLVDLSDRCLRSGLAIPATLSSNKPDKLVIAKREFDEMIKLSVIEPSDSEWSSALHMVPKKTATGDNEAVTAV